MYFFFDHTVNVKSFIEGKHCLHIVKSVSTIKNWLQFVSNTTNDDIAAKFLLLKHF